MNIPVFRFAPSPNGLLHLGHAYSALVDQHFAERLGGRLLLRLEDIDAARCTPEYEAAIFRDLAWLGIGWENPVRRQSDHFGEYEAALNRLRKEELVYPASMSRGEVRAFIADRETAGENWPRDPDGVPLYPGSDRRLSGRKRAELLAEGIPFAWRLDMAAALERVGAKLSWSELSGADLSASSCIEARPQDWGDVILARRDVPTSYHLSVVLDDALQGVTHVVRGMDLYAATAVHRVLQELLDLPAPGYRHHRLILGPDGRKLSKSFQDTGIAALREQGATPEAVRRMAGLEEG
ncbi:tRNA glutamyl-Q(34) synthetase GluQRS [Pseudaminobacter sp. 19-2017]|uniref:tRNA glutamyl-Q(34) synthetase GluQRS n=1 Tax=Pseudaminobacter soli (ex Zhang et al. 2022) TaxID=2831468 RepID=A0A942DVD4_9HYPH|nr:tRNA glutamyl-Q(34) synthetase GluQRS [Pseudaminobacter soli]MBS3647979.1 tRNA glutamyl-Q(34) synthetase GluQRS [Pseudaminobacter soli]